MDGDSKTANLIVAELMAAAENKRDSLTVILAGYKDDIEARLFGSDDGFKSRFLTVEFEDFGEAQLRTILSKLIGRPPQKKKFPG